MNKKAMILYYPILVGFVVGLAVFYVSSLTSDPKGQTNYVGEIALNYIKTAKSAENTLLYIQNSAKQASYQSIYDLALKGGFYSESECGSYQESNLWTSETNTCYPNTKQNLGLYLKDNMNYHLIINENTFHFKDNYDFRIQQEDNKLRIMGIATLPIKIPILIKEKIKKKTVKKQIGNYSIKPSFEHLIDYNLNDYETIKQKESEIASTCEKETDVEKCVEQKIIAINALHRGKPEENPLKWHIGSSEPAEKIFYDFTQKYESCLNSKDMDCTCNFKLEYEDSNLKGKYDILISKDGSDTKIKLVEPEGHNLVKAIKGSIPAVISDYYTGSIKYLKSFHYVVIYTSTGNYETTVLSTPITTYDFGFTKETRLYKKDKNSVIFIRKDSTEYQNLKECSSPNIFRFTVANENKKFFVYDKTTKKAEFKPIEIRFAINIKDLPPPPIDGLKVQNEEKAEGSVLLKWKKSQATDVASYNVYYSKGNFLRREIKNHEIIDPFFKIESNQINTKVTDENTYERISSGVVYDRDKKIWGHVVIKDGIKIEKLVPGQLYYHEEDQEYFYILDGLEDNKKYYFVVTAVDKAGNEINNKDQEQKLESDKNYVSATPEDNLAPGKIYDLVHLNKISPHLVDTSFGRQAFNFKLPTLNEDGTPLKKTILYLYIYQIRLNPSESCNFEAVKDKLSMPVTKKLEPPFDITKRADAIPPYLTGDFCYTFILRDEAGNPNLDEPNLKNLVETKLVQLS